jgi:4-aminobutyrate aminotransferase-like enzyme
MDRLRRELGAHPSVREVRGIGLMIGVELADKAVAQQVAARCLASGVIVLACGPDENVLRLAPPLTVGEGELAQGLDVLCEAILASG